MITDLSQREIEGLPISDLLLSIKETNNRRLDGVLKYLVLRKYVLRARTGQRVTSISSSQSKGAKGLMKIGLDLTLSGWFLATNSGKKQTDIEPSGSVATLFLLRA